MTPSLFTVSTNLNLDLKQENGNKKNLKYLFLLRKQTDGNKICFSVLLKNDGNSIINTIWFSAFIGVGKAKFTAGTTDQKSFYFKNFNLEGSYLYGYTKEWFKLPPETTLEILYFEIQKDKLSDEGSIEFYFGSESIKKISFRASWGKDEINKIKDITPEKFLNFLKYKNSKTCFEHIELFLKRGLKDIKVFLNWLEKFLRKKIDF